jgi:hypothetical protein
MRSHLGVGNAGGVYQASLPLVLAWEGHHDPAFSGTPGEQSPLVFPQVLGEFRDPFTGETWGKRGWPLREAAINKSFSAVRDPDRGVAHALEKGRVGEGIAGLTECTCENAAAPSPFQREGARRQPAFASAAVSRGAAA